MSTCKTCGKTHEEVGFYSGIKTYCKEHWREKVRNNRAANVDYYRAFDRQRASNPKRVDARKSYQETDAYAVSHAISCKQWKVSNPDKRAAHVAVNNAVRDGRLQPLPCFVCGSDQAEAHHPDYSLPLEVIWLCDKHHKETHKLGREIIRKERERSVA